MRTIDADGLKELFNSRSSHPIYDEWSTLGILGVIDEMPTIDVAEVKHGHNLSNTPSYFVCSLCGDNCCDVYTYEPSQFNYCPNCGAKMDGGSE